MGLVRTAKKWINKRKNKSLLLVFINNNENALAKFEKIDFKIPPEISKIIEEYKIELKEQINNVKKLQKEIKLHNKEIESISDILGSFNYNEILKNPTKSKCLKNLEIYFEATEKIKKYKPDQNYSKCISDINKIYKNKNVLLKEYALFNRLNSICAIKNNEFLDSNFKEKLKMDFAAIKKEINEPIFYNFDKLNSIDEIINNKNSKYVEKELSNEIFDNVNGLSLDKDQRKAILEDETASLVVAGAGSGKTLTICGKIKYLIEHLNVNPKDILVLSYSKESSLDLEKKLSKINNNLRIGTFHKLGLDIIKDSTKIVPTVSEQYDAIIEKFFREELFKPENIDIATKILNYYALYLNHDNESIKYESKGKQYEELKKKGFTTLKETLIKMSDKDNENITIKKEHVKSAQELAIANYYFINGINYEYEKPFEKNTASEERRQYKPDFYLTDYNVYHEHYGINKDGNASQYSGKEAIRYKKGIIWKRTLHKELNTDYFETYSYEFNDETIFEKIESELKKRNIALKPLPQKEIINCIQSIYNGQSFKSFINLVKSFISLYKAKYQDDTYFQELENIKQNFKFEQTRIRKLLEICKYIYKYYLNILAENNMIDFDDMIIQSKKHLKKLHNYKYKYIIVDEFQDISYSRMQLLKELINHGSSKLFAVGDDWQAIYRFAGCDLNIFTKFNEYFPYCKINFITTTHRNSQQLQNIIEPFITANPEQYKKAMASQINKPQDPVVLVYCDNDKYKKLITILDKIHSLKNDGSVLLLGRNNNDLDFVLSDNLYAEKRTNDSKQTKLICKDFPTLKIKFSTVHSSKGIEDEFVVLLNAEDSPNGFPNRVEDDPILNLVLSQKSSFPYDEERRLWYVALTRTKSYVFILVENYKPSPFVLEIEDKCVAVNKEITNDETNQIYCPNCKTGHLVLRNSHGESFYGCSNFPYCDYLINDLKAVNNNLRCPDCGDFLILRKTEHGKFYGCHSYPKCKYTKNIYYKKPKYFKYR